MLSFLLVFLAAYLIAFCFAFLVTPFRKLWRGILFHDPWDSTSGRCTIFIFAARLLILGVLWPFGVALAIELEKRDKLETRHTVRNPKKLKKNQPQRYIPPVIEWTEEDLVNFVNDTIEKYPKGLSLEDDENRWTTLYDFGKHIPLESYNAVSKLLTDARWGISGLASDEHGRKYLVSLQAADLVSQPFLIRTRKPLTEAERGRLFDEDKSYPIEEWPWRFSTDPASWANLGGRAGLAQVRNEIVEKLHVSIMN